jgi:sugar/nucleoside kinase (ribokinase family)
MSQNGERTIFHNRDANEKLEIKDATFKDAEWIFLSSLNGPWQTNIKKILALKEQNHFLLAYNPGQHNIKEDSSAVLQALAVSNVLVLNKDEAIELVMHTKQGFSKEELDDEVFLLQALHQAGAQTIGMTDGKRGAWGFDGKEYWYCPIYTRSGVLDTTGAGDAFGSGFFAAHLAGLSVEQGLRYGIANSGSVVGCYGAVAGLLHEKEIEQLLEHIVPERLN